MRHRHLSLPGAMLALFAALPAPALAEKFPVAVFSGLDKITARVDSFEAKVDEPLRFGSLEVLVRDCDKRPPEEPPRTAAYVEIRQLDRDDDGEAHGNQAPPIFKGWMFAESPGLNALEHPVYDIWVTDCKM
ncbi:DUF2155 domain-containing protein [Parvibaculum sp.]|uniref:DUF2155 domain-containing protein n=1 Tax=Parvibaculum sp. TaxID=2024848 RepID=UPI00391D6FF6